ncbi:uncharacterized protein htt [Drosophila montana]|uniref:uncharacterized protein htt n=1 Tax=Drosophila montana TaxID=40370 RepID=UPI00313D2ABA
MDKSSAYEKFTGHVDQLRNTECSQKQKIACFQQIAECIMSAALAGHINYAAHCGTATNVLLLFCEDFDSVVRMSAEENLNKIFRALEKTRVSRILMDLYGEIKRNGNQRSLRICLNLFSYYAPQIKEKHIKWYAVRLLQCMSIMSQRKETLLQETLSDFVKHFGRYVQQGLNDSETCKLLETFLGNISSDCAVKRRCSAQNCISLIEHARNRSLMARHGLSKVIEMLLMDQQTSCVLGALGLLRLLMPQLIRGYSSDYQDDGDSVADAGQQQQQQLAAASDCRQIIEIYDYCLHLLSTQHTANHAIINAALEVINGILQALQDGPPAATQAAGLAGVGGLAQSLRQLLCNQQLEHNEYLRRRKSLKNQIFQLKNYEVGTSQQEQAAGGTARQMQMAKNSNAKLQQQKCQQQQQQQQEQLQIGINLLQVVGINATADDADTEEDAAASSAADEVKKTSRHQIRNAARSISECVASNASDEEELHQQALDDNDDDGDDDMELLSAIADDEYDDGFTTLSQLNEAQPTVSAVLKMPNITAAAASATTPAVHVDVDVDVDVASMPKPQAVQHQSSLQNLLASDDRSQHLSDIDNESFNSIDFDAEITIAGVREQQTAATATSTTTATTTNESAESMPDATAIGTFFNNLLSHSNAASESVSKLFRQSSGPKSTPTKSTPTTDKSDAASTASLTLSLSSLASSSATGLQEHQLSITETPTPLEETTASASGSYTASTALLMDVPSSAAAAEATAESELEPQLRRTPNANPFLAESSPLKQTISGRALISVKIGSTLEQSLVYYTSRLLAARFLLTGQASGLHPDNVSRVSIKSLSLAVMAQCVRLAPRVLQLPLEISEQELQLLEQVSASSTQVSSPQSSTNSQRSTELDQLAGQSMTGSLLESSIDNADNQLLLDIKDDHFGPSTCPAYLQQSPTLSRSADAALLQCQLEARRPSNLRQTSVPDSQLSRSEIIGSAYRATVASEDAPPLALPPLPPKRTKSMRSRTGCITTIATPSPLTTPKATAGGQALSDVLLYHGHCDPMLRGGVQQIVGNFVQASSAGRSLQLQPGLGLSHLLAILLKGFEDEIHTVVIQALNAFDKIFPHVVSKYLTGPPCHYHAHQKRQQLQQQQQQPSGQQKGPGQAQTFGQQTFPKNLDNALSSQQQQQQEQEQQQWHSNDDNSRAGEARICARSSATDNDELLAALLNDFQLQSKRLQQHSNNNNNNSNKQYNEPGPCCVFAISPKLLLNKLRLCRHNKYWLVQNKYAEVISNLNYVLLRSYYANFDSAFDNNNNNDNNNSNNDSKLEPKDHGPATPDACNWNTAACNKDIVCTYEAQFLDELLQLLGDDDARVREHAAHCLCRFIMQTARQQEPPSTAAATTTSTTAATRVEEGNMNAETQQTNFNLLWDFFDYRIFGSMSVTLRNLFRASSTIAPPMAALDAVEHGHGPYAATAEAVIGVGGTTIAMGGVVGAAAAASAYFDGSYGVGIADGHVFAIGFERQIAQEEKVLAKLLYRMTNKLMTLNDKNLQFGIINALRLLLKHFNFVDYQQAWTEFNFIEICMSYAYYNSATAGDLNCQNDLIDVMAKLIAGGMLSSGEAPPTAQLDFLLRHCVKLLNIYYHLVGNQRPVQPSGSGSSISISGGSNNTKPSKTVKSELFTLGGSGRETLAALQAMGYFASDYVYMKLYNILRGANDSYKITINHEAGGLLICLLKSCLNALSLCLEASTPSPPPPPPAPATATLATANASALKLIEEILQYLTKLINYAPGECVACLRQLLKYLFGQNYASQEQRQPHGYHATFVRPYFVAKRSASASASGDFTLLGSTTAATTTPAEATATTQQLIASQSALGALFVRGMQPNAPPAGDCVRLIKLFEPLVIYCLTLFMKCNALIQAPILKLLSQLLDLNVTYSILDSKSVIFEQILNNLDLIESGIDRNAPIIVPVMLKFLMQLTHKSDRQLITIPKIISITNNLLANGAVRDVALLALKTLSYELFFMHSPLDEALEEDASAQQQRRGSCQSPLTAVPTQDTKEALLAQRRELDTQKEVVLGMLEKFIDARAVQQLLALLLLYERSLQHLDAPKYLSAQDANVLYGMVCRSLATGQLRLHTFGDLRLLESCFRNNGNYVLADSKEFLQLLQLFIEQEVGNFGDLALAMIMLANVILKTEEIYLVNHIKLYLKNNPTAERRLQAAAAAAAAATVTSTTASAPESSTLHWQDEAPSTSSAAAAARATAAAAAASNRSAARPTISEINYFAKVLSEKLLGCLDALLALGSGSTQAGHAYCQLAGRFVNALHNVCCRSRHKDALQSVFRLVLAESEFLCKYYNLLLMSAEDGDALEPVLLACLQLLLSMRLLEPMVLLGQAAELPLKWSLQRAMLHEVCQESVAIDWSPQQVRRLCAGKYLNFLIADHLEFLSELCQVRPECGSLLLAALLRHSHNLNKHSIRSILRLLCCICVPQQQDNAALTLQALQLLSRLHQLHDGQRALQLPMERLARRLAAQSSPATRSSIYERLLQGELAGDEDQDELRTMLLKDLECPQDNSAAAPPRIIDESWLFGQLIKFATQHAEAPQQQQQLMRLLLEIQSEAKLQRLLRSLGPVQEARLLRHALDGALSSMVAAFRQKCIQHAPHINYMQLPPLARVACASLMTRLAQTQHLAVDSAEQLDVARALSTLLVSIRSLEQAALIYIDAKHIEKFVVEHLLRPEQLPALLAYARRLASAAVQLLQAGRDPNDGLGALLGCLDELLRQPRIWWALNASSDELRVELLQVPVHAACHMLQDTVFYQRHRLQSAQPPAQAIFLAKLIETQIDIGCLLPANELVYLPFAGHELAPLQVPLPLIASIGTSLLRLHQLYAYAVTPYELVQQQQQQLPPSTTARVDGKLPPIPVDSLSDVDVLRQFVKRLSIFGYTTRQQFEEYFMTFLLLINKEYDEHMVDQQEQFQIKQVCLLAIMELLTTYKTFPIAGHGNSQFYHTTRWQRINCDSISLKKLHKVQLLVDATCNVFYLANLERHPRTDNVIGTRNFAANQCDLNFSWALMEAYAQMPPYGGETAADEADGASSELGIRRQSTCNNMTDTNWRNYRHYVQLSGIDFRSSTQLVFDVLQQMIELNHVLVLPNLVKFCEICESRDQIKWIKERTLRLQDQVAMDDTISHEHIIYLLCRTQALLIPSHGELQHLAALIGNVYLKSSHCFIRIAALQGLLCLLECCSRTNTAMGKLSDELTLLRDLIVGYINRHGIIDESPLQFSDAHTKLVWTLNYSLIEWTSKFVPQCHLLSNTIIAANNFLKKTQNEELYLCVLHGLERIVVNSGCASAAPTAAEATGSVAGGGVGDAGPGTGAGAGAVVTPQLRHKIEKLALELLKMENEKFSIPALKLLLSCMYVGSSTQLENTELSNGIVQDDPEIIALQSDKVDILLHCIKSSSRDAAWIYGQVLCQIIRDLVPPNEILTKVIKEFLAINQPHGDVIATIVYQVFRSAIDSSFLQMLQDWLICTLPTFLDQPELQGVWGLSVIFLSASINLHLIKLFPLVVGIGAASASGNVSTAACAAMAPRKLGQHEIALFVTAAQDFHAKLSAEQKLRFREAFRNYEQSQVYASMLQRL